MTQKSIYLAIFRNGYKTTNHIEWKRQQQTWKLGTYVVLIGKNPCCFSQGKYCIINTWKQYKQLYFWVEKDEQPKSLNFEGKHTSSHTQKNASEKL